MSDIVKMKKSFISHSIKTFSNSCWRDHVNFAYMRGWKVHGQQISYKQITLFSKNSPSRRLVVWNVVFMKTLNVISQASGFLLFPGESKNGDRIGMIPIS